MKQKLERIEIDRAKWRSGEGSVNGSNIGEGCTQLLNDEGYMCCLGQLLLHYGYSENDIWDKGEPDQVRQPMSDCPLFTEGSFSDDRTLVNSNFSTNAMCINDDTLISQRQREAGLRNLAEGVGIKLVFKGKATKL